MRCTWAVLRKAWRTCSCLTMGACAGFSMHVSMSRISLGGEVRGVTRTRLSAWSVWRRLTAARMLVAQEWLLGAPEMLVVREWLLATPGAWTLVAQEWLPGTPARSPRERVVRAGELEASGRQPCGGQSSLGRQVPGALTSMPRWPSFTTALPWTRP